MRSTVIGLCCAPIMELLLTELGKWWTVICARPQGVGRRDQMGRAPYLDSSGPNGVVFPFSSCNMGGHLLRRLRSMDVMKNDPRGALKCNTYGSMAANIHKQSCRQWKPNTDLNMQVKDVNTRSETHTHSSCKKLYIFGATLTWQFPSVSRPITFYSVQKHTFSTTPSDTHSASHTKK